MLSVIDRSFIGIEYKKGIYLIDQHAACEKILYMEKYEELRQQRPRKEVKRRYLVPNIYEKLLVDRRALWEKLGWGYRMGKKTGTHC